MFRISRMLAAPMAVLALLLTACDGGSGTSGDTGRLSLYVTDAPVHSVDQVWVTFDAVELKPQSGPPVRIPLDPPVRENLLELQGENAAVLLDDVELEAGQYNWVRLFVVSDELDTNGVEPSMVHELDGDESAGKVKPSMVRELDGGEFRLFVPGNQPPSRNPNQRFVQLSSPFVIPANGEADFTIDVDLLQALVRKDIPAHPEPFYMLRPSLRIVDNSEVGTIYGTVADTLICPGDAGDGVGNAVYVYSGVDVTPGDVYLDENGEVIPRDDITPPVTTANVVLDTEDGVYRYTVGFLSAGDYTVAFTCDAGSDQPDSNDLAEIDFLQKHEVIVGAGERVEQDFTDE